VSTLIVILQVTCLRCLFWDSHLSKVFPSYVLLFHDFITFPFLKYFSLCGPFFLRVDLRYRYLPIPMLLILCCYHQPCLKKDCAYCICSRFTVDWKSNCQCSCTLSGLKTYAKSVRRLIFPQRAVCRSYSLPSHTLLSLRNGCGDSDCVISVDATEGRWEDRCVYFIDRDILIYTTDVIKDAHRKSSREYFEMSTSQKNN